MRGQCSVCGGWHKGDRPTIAELHESEARVISMTAIIMVVGWITVLIVALVMAT
jgi:hypothetical protein